MGTKPKLMGKNILALISHYSWALQQTYLPNRSGQRSDILEVTLKTTCLPVKKWVPYRGRQVGEDGGNQLPFPFLCPLELLPHSVTTSGSLDCLCLCDVYLAADQNRV